MITDKTQHNYKLLFVDGDAFNEEMRGRWLGAASSTAHNASCLADDERVAVRVERWVYRGWIDDARVQQAPWGPPRDLQVVGSVVYGITFIGVAIAAILTSETPWVRVPGLATQPHLLPCTKIKGWYHLVATSYDVESGNWLVGGSSEGTGGTESTGG